MQRIPSHSYWQLVHQLPWSTFVNHQLKLLPSPCYLDSSCWPNTSYHRRRHRSYVRIDQDYPNLVVQIHPTWRKHAFVLSKEYDDERRWKIQLHTMRDKMDSMLNGDKIMLYHRNASIE